MEGLQPLNSIYKIGKQNIYASYATYSFSKKILEDFKYLEELVLTNSFKLSFTDEYKYYYKQLQKSSDIFGFLTAALFFKTTILTLEVIDDLSENLLLITIGNYFDDENIKLTIEKLNDFLTLKSLKNEFNKLIFLPLHLLLKPLKKHNVSFIIDFEYQPLESGICKIKKKKAFTVKEYLENDFKEYFKFNNEQFDFEMEYDLKKNLIYIKSNYKGD